MSNDKTMEKIVALAKRRGFVFPGSEIYNGIGGIYDLGPLGVELVNNIKTKWWRNIVRDRDDVVGIDSAILMNKEVWKTSGHEGNFSDPLVECKNCHNRFREDHLPKSRNCPSCGKNDWTPSRQFNLMFKTHIGPTQEEGTQTYLRPETAQGIFINFKNVVDTTRIKIPFGIAQIGKGFRNEITTGNFLFRVREFEMMELEYFTTPDRAKSDFEYWKKERMNWHLSLGLDKENLRFRAHEKNERAHYASESVDIEYNWPFMGWGELEGIANRTDFDLREHSKVTGKDLTYFDEKSNKQITPYVIEPSIGIGRLMLALLTDAYKEEKGRVVLQIKPELSPNKVAVFPLLANKPELSDLARKIYLDLKSADLGTVVWDDRGNIGKRYYAQDEAGTPFCITVDFDSTRDNTVTVRERDSMKQERVKIEKLPSYLQSLF